MSAKHDIPMMDGQTQTSPSFKHICTMRSLQENFVPGIVISTPWHDPDHVVSNATRNDLHRIKAAFGRVYPKPRKVIILIAYEYHCMPLSTFGFNQNGLVFEINKDGSSAFMEILSKQHHNPKKSTVSLPSRRRRS